MDDNDNNGRIINGGNKYDGYHLYLLYEKKIIECRKARQRCDDIKKQQLKILEQLEVNNQNLINEIQAHKESFDTSSSESFNDIYKLVSRYFKINQRVLNSLGKILTELSNISFENKKSDAVIISLLSTLLQSILNNKSTDDFSLQDLLERVLQQKELPTPINIHASGDANLNNAGNKIEQNKGK